MSTASAWEMPRRQLLFQVWWQGQRFAEARATRPSFSPSSRPTSRQGSHNSMSLVEPRITVATLW